MQKVHYLQSYIIIKGNSIKRMYWHSLTNHFLVWSTTISFIEPILVYIFWSFFSPIDSKYAWFTQDHQGSVVSNLQLIILLGHN